MNLTTTKASDKATALVLIESGTVQLVELDYEACAADVIELGKIGRRHNERTHVARTN